MRNPQMHVAQAAGHEIVGHPTEGGDEGIIKLRDRLWGLIDEKGRRAYFEGYLHAKDGLSYDNATAADLLELKNEMLADFIGNRFNDKDWLESIAVRRPALFGNFVRSWLRMLDQLIGALTGMREYMDPAAVKQVDQYLTDLQAGKKIAEDIAIRWAERHPGLARKSGVQQSMKQKADPVKVDQTEFQAYLDAVGPAPQFSRRQAAADEYAAVEQQYRGTAQWMRAPNGEPTKLTERQWVQVRTKQFKQWFGNWEALAGASMNRRATTLDEARRAAASFVGEELENVSTGLHATLSNGNLGKMTSRSAAQKSISGADHALAVANADQLFINALLDHSHPDSRGEPTIAAIHRYVAPMVALDGRVVAVKLTVKETTGPNEPNPLYSIETLEIENPPSVLSRVSPDGTGTHPQAGWSPNIQELLSAVNPDGVSKAVDDNGEPLVLYHGTDKGGFMMFDEPGGERRGDLGIFTTDDRSMARS